MKKTEIWYFAITIVTITSFAALIYFSILQVLPRDIPPEAVSGKDTWERHGCMQCHAIVGSGGYSAVDLTDILSHRDNEWLKEFFRNPPMMRPDNIRRHPALEESEIKNMMAYLRVVNEINTRGWPPPPIITQSEEDSIQ